MGQVCCWFLLANVPSSNSPDRKTKKHTMSGLNIEQHCATLQRIALQHPESSAEYQSVELAAKALLYIFMNKHTDEFLQQLEEYNQPDTHE